MEIREVGIFMDLVVACGTMTTSSTSTFQHLQQREVSFVNYSNCWSLCLFVCLKFDIYLYIYIFLGIVSPIPDLIVNWHSNILVTWQNCRFHKILTTSSCNWHGLSSASVSVSSLIWFWIPFFVHGEMEMLFVLKYVFI